jgi:hypothetical protein
MSNTAARVIFSIVGLVVGVGVALLIRQKLDESKPDNYLIAVHSNGQVSVPEAHISKTAHHKVAWAADGGAALEIAFPESEFPQDVPKKLNPFVNMTQRPSPHGGTEWVVACGNGVCFSGEINPDLTYPSSGKLRYKYDQIVSGTRTDGIIIIDR